MKRPRASSAVVAAAMIVAMAGWLLAPLGSSNAVTRSSRTAAATTNRITGIPVHGTFGSGGTFAGRLDLSRIGVSNGHLVGIGSLSGTAKRANGSVAGRVIDAPVQLPLALPDPTCQILHLVLGPLDLNLLGLHIHLNRVVLDITAESGPGNLLGNLLCAVAHLLDNPPALNSVLQSLVTAIIKLVGALHLL